MGTIFPNFDARARPIKRRVMHMAIASLPIEFRPALLAGLARVLAAVLDTWLKFARIARGPLFRAVVGREVRSESLNDRHVARPVKRLALAAGVRGDLSERERQEKFAGHSLRAGLASSAEVNERYVQKHLGHASAEMTRRYQRRRDQFRVNLTKAAGL